MVGRVGSKVGEKENLASILGPLRTDIYRIKDNITDPKVIKEELNEFDARKKKLEKLELEYPNESAKLEDVKNELISLQRKLKDTKGAYAAEELIKSCEKLLGTINKLLYPIYKKEALKKVKTGARINLFEQLDLEGLEEKDKEFLIGELEKDRELPGWIDRKEKVVYKASESLGRMLFFGIVFFLLAGFLIPALINYLRLYELVGVSDIPYSIGQLITFYFFGCIGFLAHLLKKVKEEISPITSFEDFFKWFSTRWIAFIETGGIFWLGFILLVSTKQGSIINAFLLGYAIDSFSEVILARYKLLAHASTEIKL